MKSKGFTYILLIIVAIVWYNVFFRIKSNFVDDDKIFTPSNSKTYTIPTSKKDTFDIKADYSDPFGFISSQDFVSENIDAQSNIKENNSASINQPIEQKMFWPQIKYKGIIKEVSSEYPLCLLKVDNELFNLIEGDYFLDNLHLKKVNKDYVEIEYGTESKIIKLN